MYQNVADWNALPVSLYQIFMGNFLNIDAVRLQAHIHCLVVGDEGGWLGG